MSLVLEGLETPALTLFHQFRPLGSLNLPLVENTLNPCVQISHFIINKIFRVRGWDGFKIPGGGGCGFFSNWSKGLGRSQIPAIRSIYL